MNWILTWEAAIGFIAIIATVVLFWKARKNKTDDKKYEDMENEIKGITTVIDNHAHRITVLETEFKQLYTDVNKLKVDLTDRFNELKVENKDDHARINDLLLLMNEQVITLVASVNAYKELINLAMKGKVK